MKEWCLGFVFSNDCESVVLIRKTQTMHIGLWNGVGGKIEPSESAEGAMVRECQEETKLCIERWVRVGRLQNVNAGDPWCVHIFASEIPIDRMDEITADWAVNASPDTPFKVPLDSLGFMRLAPHTEVLAYAAKARVRDASTALLDFLEIG